MSLNHLFTVLKGSGRSGNYGHGGRPGKIGGSSTGGGHIKLLLKKPAKKKVEPKKESEKKIEVPIKRLSKVLKNTLHLRDEDSPKVTGYLEDLNKLPDKLLTKLANKGVEIYMGDRQFTELDSNQIYKGVQPRGWPPGTGWDTVRGAYNRVSKELTIAGKGQGGSTSPILHEYGHAVHLNGVLGEKRNNQLKEINKKLYNKLPAYYQQGGPGGQAGTEEMWAEGFATAIKNRPQAIKTYGKDFVDIVDEVLNVD